MSIILNDQQQFIVNEAYKWFYHSSSSLFQFTGYAGTGKSVTLNAIINALNLRLEEILPMSFTGQAASVMRKKGLITACTCHSGLFEPIKEKVLDKNGNPVIDTTYNTPLVKWNFAPRSFKNSGIKLIILDEAWMIPKRFKKFIDSTGIKVIATGDPGQLPPIGDDPGYLVDGEIHRLTELMRQSSNSPIVYLANRAREGLQIEPGLYGNDALVIFDDELTNQMISGANIVLCCKNITRDAMNKKIRNDILSYHTDFPNYGERLICRKNNWGMMIDGIALVNGLTGTVVRPPDVGSFNGKTLMIDFLPDLLDNSFDRVCINYKYLNSNYEEKELIKNSPYEIGELFEYAYSSTVHLSQGSEYNNGIYMEEFLRGDLQNSLNYTAITRFKNKFIYVKYKPKFWTF